MKKTIFSLAAIALFATSCSDTTDITLPVDQSDKEMISFSLSDEAQSTRAGFTGSATKIAMRMQSDEKGGAGVRYTRTVATAAVDETKNAASYSTVTFDGAYQRYWDDAFGRKGQISVYAVAVPNGSTVTNNGTTLENLLTRGDATNDWGSNATNTIAWQVTTSEQTKNAADATAPTMTIDLEDLTYSNNIKDGGTDGRYVWDYSAGKYTPDATGATTHAAGRMVFTQKSGEEDTSNPGHFDKGHLVFKHALSRMTITLVAGEGFDEKPFAFAGETNIKLLNMNVSGTLDIKTGAWSSVTSGDINKIARTTSGTTAAGTYAAQMLPGYTFGKTSNTNVMQFTIDNNTYYITQKMLFDALVYDADGDGEKDTGDGDLISMKGESGITMEQGKNYNFTITIKKTRIENITATLVDWVDVTGAEFAMNNSHVEFSFLTPTNGTTCSDFQFYRLAQDLGSIITTDSYSAANYSGDYKTEGAATVTDANSDGKYETNWFFEDNKTAYHFRTLNQKAADENGTSGDDKSENIANTGDPAKSYFTMRAGATTQDYHWGAPMKTDATLAYSPTEGYQANLHKGLTSTDSDIKITEMHMMSNINIVLKTTTSTDKVVLSGATVTLTKLSKDATVDIGIGLITPNVTSVASNTQVLTSPGTGDAYWETANVQTKPFTCAVIPQALVRNSGASDDDYIGITITTSDNNQYYVVRKLSQIYAESTKQGGSAYTDPDQKTASDSDDDATKAAAYITRWYPNHSYTYTFTITKNGIDNITCTLAQWIDVTAANKDITLED